MTPVVSKSYILSCYLTEVKPLKNGRSNLFSAV